MKLFDKLFTKKKDLKSRILDSHKFGDLEIRQADPAFHTKGKSNIYAIDSNEKKVWYAELPWKNDYFPNPIQWNKELNVSAANYEKLYLENSNSFVAHSMNGFTVSIDYKTGKIVSKQLTK